MKKYKVKFENGATHDILGIIDYIENEYSDPLSAAKIATKIYHKCETLSVFPKAAPIRRNWSSKKGTQGDTCKEISNYLLCR